MRWIDECLGGGVMEQPQLFPLVRTGVLDLLNDYVQAPEILERIDAYIVPPALGSRAGVLGAPTMRIFAGNLQDGQSLADAQKNCVESIEACADHAARRRDS